MQRGFFRSEEMTAVDPTAPTGRPRPDWESDTTEVVVPKPLKKPQSPLVPLRGATPSSPPVPSEPPRTEPEPEELAPLRRASAQSPHPVEPEPLRPAPAARTQPEPEPAPRTVTRDEPGRVSGSLVFVLLLVVGVLIWREQTRPPVPTQEPLPVPRSVNVSEPRNPVPADPADTAPAEVSPYPGMEPQENPDALSTEGADAPVEPGDISADRRSAILEDVSETTGVDPREEPQIAHPEPTQEMTENVARTAPPADSPVIPEPWRTSGPEDGGTSLFPTTNPAGSAVVEKPPVAEKPPTAEKPPVAENPPVVEVKPPPKLPTIEGDPYKIAEPNL